MMKLERFELQAKNATLYRDEEGVFDTRLEAHSLSKNIFVFVELYTVRCDTLNQSMTEGPQLRPLR